MPLATEQFNTLVRLIDAHNINVRRFIDLGTGSGTVAAVVFSRFPDAHGVLLDFSPPMLDAARNAFARTGFDATFVRADLMDRGWLEAADPEPVDLIVSGYTIHHLPDERKRALYGEIFSRLARGGLFVNIEHVASPSAALHGAWETLMVEALIADLPDGATADDREAALEGFWRRQSDDVNLLAPVEEQLAWLRDAGFADVDLSFKYFEFAVFGGRKPANAEQ